MASIPNLLTLLRLFLAPLVILAILERDFTRALTLFAVAGATDGLDGYLARRFRWISRFGAYVDPVADKVLLSGIYLALGAVHAIPSWLVAVVFGRDLLILLAVAVAMLFTRLRNFQPSVWGKLSTLLQIASAVVFLAQFAFPHLSLGPLADLAIFAVAGATAWSGVHYALRAFRIVRIEAA